MKRKQLLFVFILSGIIIAGECLAAGYHWDFEKRTGMTPYPRDAASRVTLTQDAAAGKKALSIANIAGKNTSVYNFIKLPGKAGKLNLEVTQKMSGTAPLEFTISLYFNRQGGKQGSAGGRQLLRVTGSKDWKVEKFSVPVPEAAVAMQLVISIGKEEKTLFLDDLKCEFVSDEKVEK